MNGYFGGSKTNINFLIAPQKHPAHSVPKKKYVCWSIENHCFF